MALSHSFQMLVFGSVRSSVLCNFWMLSIRIAPAGIVLVHYSARSCLGLRCHPAFVRNSSNPRISLSMKSAKNEPPNQSGSLHERSPLIRLLIVHTRTIPSLLTLAAMRIRPTHTPHYTVALDSGSEARYVQYIHR